jgi:hypothetical protein
VPAITFGHLTHTTGVRFEDNAPLPTRAFLSGPSHSGDRIVAASVFATDALCLSGRLTITAGVRFDTPCRSDMSRWEGPGESRPSTPGVREHR